MSDQEHSDLSDLFGGRSEAEPVDEGGWEAVFGDEPAAVLPAGTAGDAVDFAGVFASTAAERADVKVAPGSENPGSAPEAEAGRETATPRAKPSGGATDRLEFNPFAADATPPSAPSSLLAGGTPFGSSAPAPTGDGKEVAIVPKRPPAQAVPTNDRHRHVPAAPSPGKELTSQGPMPPENEPGADLARSHGVQAPRLIATKGANGTEQGTGQGLTSTYPDTPAPLPPSRVAEHRAAMDAKRAHERSHGRGPAHQYAPELAALARVRRYAEADRFDPYVDRILNLGSSGDPRVQSFVKQLELTRDHDLDAQQMTEYRSLIEPMLPSQHILIPNAEDLATVFEIAYDELTGIGPLGPLWRDDTITEIMVSGPNKVTIERNGRLELTPVTFRSQEHLERTARRLSQRSNDDRAISPTNPLVTIQLPRARVQFVWRPLAVSKVAISIRKFASLLGLEELLAGRSMTQEMADFLGQAVAARATILVSGGTGSGKTTFINALSQFIPDSERVVTIEDALELQLRNTHVEAFVTKEAASADDLVLFGQDQLLKASLRMRPDRIIVGEVRDSKGCAVMLEAANTGHDGTMTTIHANSPALALRRMAQLLAKTGMSMEAACEEVTAAIDVVVQVVRRRGKRFVSNISVVEPTTGDARPVFEADFPLGSSEPCFRRSNGIGSDTDLAQKFIDAGIDPSTWEV